MRRHRRVDGEESAEAFREVFIGVHPTFQRRGIGSDLWTPFSPRRRALTAGLGGSHPITIQAKMHQVELF
jgi:hypothetical protein